ncbi:MAG TPA: DUF4253 domain-containing protein [Acidimicrobiales bacterium]|nr:DUF4253 domain-containing protein [Acidimicrobiales bacterium]
MPLFHRGHPDEHPVPDPPAFAENVIGEYHLEAGFRVSSIAGDRAESWLAVVPGEQAVGVWQDLVRQYGSGYWPLIIGPPKHEHLLADTSRQCRESENDILSDASTLDPEALLDSWRDDVRGHDFAGEWPRTAVPNNRFTLPLDEYTKRPQSTGIALLAVQDHLAVPAVIGWGGWNACPKPAEHIAMLRRWEVSYGATLAGMSSDTLEMRVSRPPATREAALRLAEEQFAYCADIVTQGTGTVGGLAGMLLDGTVWHFWWD